jgi:polyhydroxyalkanoate synthesis regulator phasin
MDNTQITKQIVQFNKTAFDNSFDAMTMVYEQNEKMVDTFLSQATWMPEEGKKAIRDWMSAYRTGCSEFKKQVDDNYAKVEAYFEKA